MHPGNKCRSEYKGASQDLSSGLDWPPMSNQRTYSRLRLVLTVPFAEANWESCRSPHSVRSENEVASGGKDSHWQAKCRACSTQYVGNPRCNVPERLNPHEQLALTVVFFASISAPISWKKVQFLNDLTWCGWSINFERKTIKLTPLKTQT